MVYEFILRTLHLTVDLVVSFLHYTSLWKYIDIIVRGQVSSLFRQDHEQIEKLPKHMGFLIAERDVSYKDLANLVIWAMTVGITCISLYDHDGVIKRNKEEFLKHLASSKRQLLGSENNLHYKLDAVPSLEIKSNGCFKRDIVVKVLSHLDGKWTIANAARSICQEVEQGVVKAGDITTELLTERLQSHHRISEPDAVIVFGSVYSSLGYLPWHIRLTEFFILPTHHQISKKDFFYVLNRYMKCEQRFGK